MRFFCNVQQTGKSLTLLGIYVVDLMFQASSSDTQKSRLFYIKQKIILRKKKLNNKSSFNDYSLYYVKALKCAHIQSYNKGETLNF